VNYLVDLGHTRIAHIYGNQYTYAGKERHKGYKDAMKANGLSLNESIMISGGYFDLKYGKLAMEKLLALKVRPTAVFVSGDMMALGAMQTCVEKGIRIPEDISIIGFDNLPMLDWIKPSLTTVSQNFDAIGDTCCHLLTDIIDHKRTRNVLKLIDTQIVIRNSCAQHKD